MLKSCPSCSGQVPSDAEKCQHCGGWLAVPSESPAEPAHVERPVQCPRCRSAQLTAQKKGFGLRKGVAGAVLGTVIIGPLGLLGAAAGASGRRRIQITCLKCGHVFQAGEGA